MSTPRRIAALIDDLRLTASSLQQVIDGCQIAGPGAEMIQHYPKMLCELATRWESEAERVELASVKATAESDLRHAREEARNHQLATEQANGLLAHVRDELSQARDEAAEAREEAARLRGQVEAIEGQRAELVKVLAERPGEKGAGKGTK